MGTRPQHGNMPMDSRADVPLLNFMASTRDRDFAFLLYRALKISDGIGSWGSVFRTEVF